MDITGKLIRILPEQRGESARGPWVRGGFVIETTETYPRQVAFTTFDEDRLAMINSLQLGALVTVAFSPESREYNERWYTDLRAINVTAMPNGMPMQGAMPPAQPMAQPSAAVPNSNFAQQPPALQADDNDDLPF